MVLFTLRTQTPDVIMSVTVKEIAPTSEQLRKYVQFGIDLYKGNDCYVPPLIFDEIATLSPEKNPAFDYCSAQSFMAYRDGKPVGRITAIINSCHLYTTPSPPA